MKNPSLKPSPLLLACFASLCFSSTIAFSQTENVKYERFTSVNGLTSNVIYSIFQDKRGYLWIGTNDGLNRYDGYTFRNYRSDPRDSFSINSNNVGMICEDRYGKLWISTTTGICQYNYEKNNFTRINPGMEEITGFENLFGDELLINTKNGKQFLNVSSLQTNPLKLPDRYRHFALDFTIITTDKNGNIYYPVSRADSTVVLKYNINTKSWEFFIDLSDHPLIRGLGRIYFVDSHGGAWIGTAVEGKILHKKSSTAANFELVSDSTGVVNQIMEDSNGIIWIATARYLFRYDHSTDRLIQINYNETDQTTSSTLTNTIYSDRSGLMWIGSYNGLFKFNHAVNRFGQFSASKKSLPLKDNFILGLHPLPGNQVVVYYHWGIRQYSIINLDKGSIEHHSLGDSLSRYLFWENFVQNKHFSDTVTWRKFANESIPYTGSFPFYMIFDKQKKLWSGHGEQIGRYGDEYYILDPSSFIMDCRISGDKIWAATNGEGLISLDVVSQHIKKYVVTGSNDGLNSNSLTSLLFEPNGDLWIGTKGGGLNYFEQQNGKFKYYTTAEGLCDNSVFNLVKDDKQRLWIGTANGISCFDPATGKFRNFFRSNGLHNSEYNRYSACKLDNGYLMMGGMDGIDYFHPDSVLTPAKKLQVQITDFKIFGKSVPDFSGIRLKHDKNYVTIDFATMDFRDPSANKFAYKLEGIDKDWVDAGNEHSISYATLSPGRYHFLVKGAGSDGVWNEDAAEIEFIILKPWWKTFWFYSGCVLVVAAILFWFYKYRIRQLKKLMRLRTKISQDLHDDVGATISGIRVFSQLAKERPGNNIEYMDKITTYSDDMLNKLSDIVWSINAENDSFSQLISKLHNYAQAMTTARNIHLEFHIDPVMEKKDLNITLRKNIYMITREAINNAVKYAECSVLGISLKPIASGAELIIIDNGKGFEENFVNGGNGLTNMQKRAEEIQSTLHVETKPGNGVVIRLFIKFT